MSPALSACSARAVYMPYANGWLGVTDHLPREAVAVKVRTAEPEALLPENSLSLILDESPGAVPADPENDGLLLFVLLPVTGSVNDTAGVSMSTVHDEW